MIQRYAGRFLVLPWQTLPTHSVSLFSLREDCFSGRSTQSLNYLSASTYSSVSDKSTCSAQAQTKKMSLSGSNGSSFTFCRSFKILLLYSVAWELFLSLVDKFSNMAHQLLLVLLASSILDSSTVVASSWKAVLTGRPAIDMNLFLVICIWFAWKSFILSWWVTLVVHVCKPVVYRVPEFKRLSRPRKDSASMQKMMLRKKEWPVKMIRKENRLIRWCAIKTSTRVIGSSLVPWKELLFNPILNPQYLCPWTMSGDEAS